MAKLQELCKLAVRTGVTYLLLILAFIIAVFLGAKLYKTAKPDIVNEIEKNFETIASEVLREGYIAIFLRNLINYVCMCTPFIGIGHSVLVIFNTGFQLGLYLARRYTVLSPTSITLLTVMLLILPHAILEMLSYSIAMEASLSMTTQVLKHRTIGRKVLIIYFAKVALGIALLYIAAVLEYSTIMLAISKGNFNLNISIHNT